MFNSTHIARNYASATLAWLVLFGAAALFKCSYLVGSYHGQFAGVPILVPLLGSMGLPLVGFLGIIRLLAGHVHTIVSVLRLPTLCGGLYWANTHWLVRVGIPVLCMGLFLVHPIGFEAWGYAMLWLIPICLWFVNVFSHNSLTLFLTALGCTMTVHAVGSVIWLYTVPMTAAQWWALIPVALCERMMFAAVMVLMYLVHRKLSGVIEQILANLGSSKKMVTT